MNMNMNFDLFKDENFRYDQALKEEILEELLPKIL
jgi:hypothetical protein